MGQGVLIPVGAKEEAQERQQLPPAPAAGEGKNLFLTFGGAETKRSAQLTCAAFHFPSCVTGFLIFCFFPGETRGFLCLLLLSSFGGEVK